jgi:transposase
MSLKPLPIPPVPEEIARVAHAVFPHGNVFIQLRDTLGTIYSDETFADLFPTHGQPAFAPWRLALVTVFQFLEGLTDRQAADAVRDRVAWKYALSLELTDPGFDHTVLSEFRSRLVAGNAEQRLLDLLLERCREGGWLKARGRQCTDSTHVLAKVRALNRTLCVAQTMVYVLNVLSEVAPDWIRTHVPDEWVERYGERLYHERLPKEEEERKHYANQVGTDGWMLLAAVVEDPATPDWMKTLPAVTTLRTIWEQQFEPREQGGQWRPEPALPAAQIINSPYDLDARNGKKRTTFWLGYKVHFTQTCDQDAPQLITHVQTTPAPLSDESALCAVHTDLAEKDLLPDQHLVDAGYVTIANLVHSQSDYRVDLVGPTLKTHWYQAETSYDLTHFLIDWEAETVICPQGQSSSSWTPVQDAGKSLIKVKFSQSDCKVCPCRTSCTGTTRRSITLHPKEQMLALFAARKREETDAFKQTYRHRAGIEGTHSQGVRTMGLRRSRSIGLPKTHLGHVAIATAVNVIQLMSWLRGEVPEQTRTSPFKRLMKQAA